MDAININPFIESIHEAFDSMLDTPVKQINMSEAGRKANSSESPDIIGVIGSTGTAQGTVALRFPERPLWALSGRWLALILSRWTLR